MSITQQHVINALRDVLHPYIGKDIVSLQLVRDIIVMDEYISFSIDLTTEAMDKKESLIAAAEAAIRGTVLPSAKIDIIINETEQRADANRTPGQGDHSLLPQVKNIIAVASGKGGVGKSTIAANVALSLSSAGYKVGLLDADIYGPSVPTLFGIHERPNITVRKTLLPHEKYGVKLLSMGFLVDADQAMIWRGPMVHGALKQFITEVEWGELDYLILDLPPGTGDIHLTIVNTIPLTGALIVSTPQKVAMDDVLRGVTMFKKVGVPVLGVVENMAYFVPDDAPEKKYYIFGKDGAKKLAEGLNIPLLGEVPLREKVRELSDNGLPIVFEHPESEAALDFDTVRNNMLNQLANVINGR